MEEGTQLAREVRRVPDSLCLQQMTALVAHNDLQSSPDCEPKSWDERIPKANAVYVLASSADDDVAAQLIAIQEAIENRAFYMRCGSDLRRSTNAPAARCGLGKVADKPTAEPSRSDLLYRRIGLFLQRGGDWRQVDLVHYADMLKTLAYAPRTRRRLPIELFFGKSCEQPFRSFVVCQKVSGKPDRPSRRNCFVL